jgi:cell division protein FtsW
MKKERSDKGLKVVIFTLLIIGLGILFSASAVISIESAGNPYYYFIHQLLYGAVPGLIVFFICQKVNYRTWKKFSLLVFFFSLVLMVLVFVPGLGLKHGGAQRWLNLGFTSIQPAEFMKLGLIIYLSAIFGKKDVHKNGIINLVSFLIIITMVGGLMTLQSDVGTLGLIVVVGFIIYFISGASFLHLGVIVTVYAAAFFALTKFFPHRIARFVTFLNPSFDPQGISYQINQAILAIGSGGILGLGPGNSMQKHNYLPEPMGDSIFAIAAEEIGFIGACVIIALFVLLAIKGLKIAKKSPDEFGKLTAIGIVSWIVFQAIINIAAITKLIPLTGIPLPFLSYGGSSMIAMMAGLGILVNISKYTRQN